jgi:hypothetical protein
MLKVISSYWADYRITSLQSNMLNNSSGLEAESEPAVLLDWFINYQLPVVAR